MVQLALDEFESVPLEASVRRVVRVANLLGETKTAIRMALEVKASGGHPPANKEATLRLMNDPSTWESSSGPAELAVNDYMAERRNSDGLIVSHSLAEIEFWQNEPREPGAMSNAQYATDLQNRRTLTEIVTRVQHHAFTLLCSWERQLSFATTQGHALNAVSNRVDVLLDQHAPEVLNQFNVAFRRLREAADRSADTPADEELSQALTSCRRILKAVVDVVQPADTAVPVSDDGHELTDDKYRNRLVEFLKIRTSSASFRTALTQAGETLFDRFTAVDTLTNKGVHARVAVEEAEFCALHTYLLAGEVVQLHHDGLPT